MIWSNEGLYLLNSATEYVKLIELFSAYSSEIVVVCCFRDIDSYRWSYMRQLEKQDLSFSQGKDSYRYVDRDSWLFDYTRKKRLLGECFDHLIFLPYDPKDMVKEFMLSIGYSSENSESFRLNVTQNR